MSDNATTFWKFLEKKIEIPIIQRDYAQGRPDKVYLRKNFLTDLKNALDKKSEMHLDFVYGAENGDKRNPLDGQQRLTTLWLLHWYIALRARQLKASGETFEKFTYETRDSSRNFCKSLCKFDNFSGFNGKSTSIVDFITNQTWFFSAWKQDPTIQAMLIMLGGTKDTDIKDGIEKVFANDDKERFDDYWEYLTGDNCKIKFYYLDLGIFKLTDDLYIKMNARGKQLSSFENFKADLILYISNQTENESLDKSERKKWGDLLNPQGGIPVKFDTNWTDIFWKNKSSDGRIDEIYFAFINRFFLNEFIVQQSDLSTEKIQKSKLYRTLYGNESNDTQVTYTSFDNYYFDKEETINVKVLEHLKDVLDNFCKFLNGDPNKLDKLIQPAWEESSELNFIPKYDEDEDCLLIKGITQQQRVVFFAICKYFEQEYYEEESFKRWMRVVWNLTGNISDEDSMISNLRLIDELAKESHNIYNYLKKSPQLKSEANKEQVDEEVEKAKKILGDEKRSNGETWEDIIITAEGHAFFKGAIRFLFRDKDGNLTDWDNFEKKWRNAKEYFDNNGVKDVLSDNYNSDALLLRYLVSRCQENDIEEICWDKKIFNNKAETWRKLLLSTDWIDAIHCILQGKTEIATGSTGCIQKWCNDPGLFKYIVKEAPDAWLRKVSNDRYYAFWESGSPRCMIPMIQVLPNLKKRKIITYRDVCDIDDSCYARCYDYGIDFSYKLDNTTYNFRWYMYTKKKDKNGADVYLLDDVWGYSEKTAKNQTDDHKKYYCLDVTDEMARIKRVFIKDVLHKLIKEKYPKLRDACKCAELKLKNKLVNNCR